MHSIVPAIQDMMALIVSPMQSKIAAKQEQTTLSSCVSLHTTAGASLVHLPHDVNIARREEARSTEHQLTRSSQDQEIDNCIGRYASKKHNKLGR
jgi:hypothetical protein